MKDAVDLYFQYYGAGKNGSIYSSMLALIKENFEISTALYPGCFIHVTPSFYFPIVAYVDSLKDFEAYFAQRGLVDLIEENKTYDEPPAVLHFAQEYSTFHSDNKYDLMISLDAGLISQKCKSNLKQKGIVFCNNSHWDAQYAWVDDDFTLIGVFENNTLVQDENRLNEFFTLKNGEKITREMVNENFTRPPSRPKYPVKEEALGYLFRFIAG